MTIGLDYEREQGKCVEKEGREESKSNGEIEDGNDGGVFEVEMERRPSS